MAQDIITCSILGQFVSNLDTKVKQIFLFFALDTFQSTMYISSVIPFVFAGMINAMSQTKPLNWYITLILVYGFTVAVFQKYGISRRE